MVQKNCSLVWQNTSKENISPKTQFSSSDKISLISQILTRGKDLESEFIVIKLPSIVIENEELLSNAMDNISILNSTGASIVIVHDYTNIVQDTLDLFGIDKKNFDTSQITDNKTSQIVEMVLSGHINKKIVSTLCSFGCNAIGISGKDGNMIEAKKHVIKGNSNAGILEFGFIGEPSIVNPEVLLNLTDSGFIPVISPIAFGPSGSTYILDLNLTASIIACITTARHLIMMEPKPIFKTTGEISLSKLRQNISFESCTDFSKQYLEIINSALNNHTEFVHLVDAKEKDCILSTIFTEDSGTKICLD